METAIICITFISFVVALIYLDSKNSTLGRKIANLFETRKLMALTLVGLFCILSLKGNLTEEFVSTVVIMAIAYYFGKSTDNNNDNNDNNDTKNEKEEK